MITASETTEIPRFAAQIDLAFDYHAYGLHLANLPTLSPAQCRQLLEDLIEPNLDDLRAWAEELGKMRKPLEAELATFEKRRLKPHDRNRMDEIRTSLRQIHDGLFHDGFEEGISPRDYALLEPLRKRTGQRETSEIIAKLERDRDYILAYLRRWPTPESTQPYSYAREKTDYRPDGTEINRGDIVRLTERQARGMTNIYVPVDLEHTIARYVADLNTGGF